ncbi:unnamed protein product [Calypogeia fissa]
MLLSGCSSEQHGGDSSEGSQSMLHQDKKAQTTLFAQRALQERRLKPPDQIIACPRCQSLNTKFCYYNNYSLTQPRHFCKNCRRYWTAGGTLRNVPVGGGCRKNKRAKQPRSNDLSVLTGDSPISGLRSDGPGSALHPAYNPSSASTSAGYYDHQYEDATKIALARAQQSIRAGPSGVSQSAEGNSSSGHVSAFHVAHGSHSSGMSHSTSSFEASPGIISLGYYQPQVQPKQEGPVMATGDLSAIFESQSYRAAAAAAAAAGQSGEGGIAYNIDMESLNNNIEAVDVQWRLHQQAAAAQKQAIWGEEDQGQREGRQAVHNVDEKGLMESLRQAKGKSAITVSPSRGHEQSEGPEANVSRPAGAPGWQLQQVSEGLQTFEPVSHDSAFWSNQSWAPLDMHALNPPASSQML